MDEKLREAAYKADLERRLEAARAAREQAAPQEPPMIDLYILNLEAHALQAPERRADLLAFAGKALDWLAPYADAQEIAETRAALLERDDFAAVDALLERHESNAAIPPGEAASWRGAMAISDIRWVKARAHFAEAHAADPENERFIVDLALATENLGYFPETERLLRLSIERAAKRHGERSMEVLDALRRLGEHLGFVTYGYGRAGQDADAALVYERALDVVEALEGAGSSTYVDLSNALADALTPLKPCSDPDPPGAWRSPETPSPEAQAVLRRAMEAAARREPWGEPHLEAIEAFTRWIQCFDDTEEEARRLLREALAHMEARGQSGHRLALWMRSRLEQMEQNDDEA